LHTLQRSGIDTNHNYFVIFAFSCFFVGFQVISFQIYCVSVLELTLNINEKSNVLGLAFDDVNSRYTRWTNL